MLLSIDNLKLTIEVEYLKNKLTWLRKEKSSKRRNRSSDDGTEAGVYYIEQPNIASGLLSTEYTFSISDGVNTFTARSSALGYAYGRQQKSTNPKMVNLAKLLYRYSLAADAYFGRQ